MFLFMGGGFKGGWRHSFDQPEQIKVFEYLSQRGFVGITIDYRLVDEEAGINVSQSVRDCKDAIRFLFQQSELLQIDPNRMAVWGSSAGGHLALMIGLTGNGDFKDAEELESFPSEVCCIVSWYGVTDFYSKHYSNPHITGFNDRFGKSLSHYKENEMRKMLSPINYLTTINVPILCIHGLDDPIIPYEQSLHFIKKANQIGVNGSLISVLNTGHGWERNNDSLIPSSDELAKITADFIQFYVNDTTK